MKEGTAFLVQRIRTALGRAQDAKWDYARCEGFSDAPKASDNNGGYLDPEAAMRWNVSCAFQDLHLLAEHLGLQQFASRIERYEEKNKAKLGAVWFDTEYENTVAPHLEEAEGFLDSLLALGAGATAEAGVAFRNILESTGVLTRKWGRPNNEADVRGVAEEVLRCAYPDLTIGHRISHPLKTYVPDFASETAKTLAEFKFVRSQKDIGTICEELHGDMFGYSGEATWMSKFAVIYQADAFWTDAQILAHMKNIGREYFPDTGMPPDWKLILVSGLDDEKRLKIRRREIDQGAEVVARAKPRKAKKLPSKSTGRSAPKVRL
jgi:hypothetical protein